MNRINGASLILLAFLLPLPLLLLLLLSLGSTGQMSKLCMDPQCKEPLFASTFTREHPISHDNFLQGKVGEIVRVVAFKFSNRVDMMEAVGENGNRGMVYSSHIDLEPYVYALEAVLKKNPKLYVVNADPTQGVTAKRLLGEKEANPEVLRDYEVHAKRLGLEVTHFEPAPSSSASSASHEHGGHGHSHSHHGHDHNHHVHHASEEGGVKEEALKEKIQKQESQTTLEQRNVAETAPGPVNESGVAADLPIEMPHPDPVVSPDPSNASTPNNTINTPSETLSQDPVVNASSEPINESPAVKVPLPNSVAGKDVSDKESSSVGEPTAAKVPAEEQTPVSTPAPPPPPQDAVVKIIPDPASIIHKPEDTLPRRKLSTLDALGGMLESNKVVSGEEASGERVDATATASPPPDPTVPGPTSTEIPLTTTYSPHIAALQPSMEEGAQDGKETATKMGDKVVQQKPAEKAAEILKNEAETAPSPEAEPQQPPSISSVPPLAAVTEAPSPSSTTSQTPPIIPESTAASAVDESKVVFESAPDTTTTTALPPTPASVSESLETARDEPVGKAESPDEKPMTSAEAFELPAPATTTQAPSEEKAPQQDYCHKDNCGEYHTELSSAKSQEMNRSSGWYHGVGNAIRGVFEPARSFLPAPLCYLDLTGLLVLAFLLLSITMHLTNMCLSSGIGRDYVDGRVLHDCMTRLKEQELVIKRYQQNAAQLKKLAETGSAAERILKEKEQLETRLNELEKSSAELEKEHDSLKTFNDRQKENLAERAREVAKLKDVLQEKEAHIKELNHHNESLTDRLSSSSSSLEQIRRELDKLKQSGEVVESKLRDKTAEVDRLEGRLHTSIEECNLHKGQCDEMQAQMDELLQIIAQLQQQHNNGEPSAAGKANGDENGAGSGGSGWSDLGEQIDVGIGDGDEEGTLRSSSERQRGRANTTHSSPPPSSTADEVGSSTGGGRRKMSATALLEVAQLKAELKRTETDRDACRISLANEQKEREALNRRMEQLREDLAEKRGEAEQREKERHDLQSQCSKLLFMVEERDRKLESIEAERERLRTKISQTESDLRNVEDAKRELALKLKELERDMRRVEEVNGKLENRLYHEDRRLTSRIRLLEEQLVKAQAAAATVNSSIGVLGDLNMSGGSSDPELTTGGNNALRALGSDVPSLWSDVEGMDMLDDFNPSKPNAIPHRQSQSRQGIAGMVPHRGSPFVLASESHHPLDRSSVNNNNSRAAIASRGGGGGEGERRGSATSRRRSRSTGRQSAKLTTATGSRGGTTQYPATYGVYGPRPLSARHNNSANNQTSPPQLYYSSEGSNGGRSPPPEMPLLSGVPPPGLAAKRPTVVMPVPVGSTAVSKLAHVQIHKPANLKQGRD